MDSGNYFIHGPLPALPLPPSSTPAIRPPRSNAGHGRQKRVHGVHRTGRSNRKRQPHRSHTPALDAPTADHRTSEELLSTFPSPPASSPSLRQAAPEQHRQSKRDTINVIDETGQDSIADWIRDFGFEDTYYTDRKWQAPDTLPAYLPGQSDDELDDRDKVRKASPPSKPRVSQSSREATEHISAKSDHDLSKQDAWYFTPRPAPPIPRTAPSTLRPTATSTVTQDHTNQSRFSLDSDAELEPIEVEETSLRPAWLFASRTNSSSQALNRNDREKEKPKLQSPLTPRRLERLRSTFFYSSVHEDMARSPSSPALSSGQGTFPGSPESKKTEKTRGSPVLSFPDALPGPSASSLPSTPTRMQMQTQTPISGLVPLSSSSPSPSPSLLSSSLPSPATSSQKSKAKVKLFSTLGSAPVLF